MSRVDFATKFVFELPIPTLIMDSLGEDGLYEETTKKRKSDCLDVSKSLSPQSKAFRSFKGLRQ